MMTINLPKDWTEVSVEQYQALQFIVDEDDIYVKNISIIAIMSGIETSKLEKVSLKSYTKLMNSLDFLNSPIENKLTRKFKLSGKKYKMVTDLYELNGGQYITLMHLLKNEDDTVRNLHQLMAVFCTPFKKKFLWFGKYEYEGDNHQEVSREMLDLPISIAYPLASFFLLNSERYESNMLASSVKQIKKIMKTEGLAPSKANTVG